jgi:glutamine amidotransferase
MTVAIVDCGGENLRSVQKAVEIHKMKAVITNDKARVSNASFVILPGVGSAQNVMQSLESKNLIETIKSLTQPVLGICIGMHILFDRSEEQDTECMKIISGNVKKFNSDRRFKVPQMGWNKVTFLKEQTKDLDDYYYFANSYYSQIINQTIATAEHSVPFTAAIQKNNFLGCQFHPEKSSFAGRKFLEYFFNKL